MRTQFVDLSKDCVFDAESQIAIAVLSNAFPELPAAEGGPRQPEKAQCPTTDYRRGTSGGRRIGVGDFIQLQQILMR